MRHARHSSPLAAAAGTLAAIIITTMLASLTGAARAADDEVVGDWGGRVPTEGSPRGVLVELKVTKLDPGQPSGEMHWDEPRQCTMTTTYGDLSDSKHVFDIGGSNGGWCDLYLSGYILVSAEGGDDPTLSFELYDRKDGKTVSGQLKHR